MEGQMEDGQPKNIHPISTTAFPLPAQKRLEHIPADQPNQGQPENKKQKYQGTLRC